MDSLTQIVLGAAVGEAVLGNKVGNKAMLYGAIAGTIPDLDVLASHFTDTVTALSMHRGFTHSIVFSVVFAPILGWLVSRYEKYKDIKGWSWLFFWAFVTHPILDSYTTWGTQLFWPFDLRLAFKTIFVVDPLYTVPFLVFLILAMRQKRTASKRSFYNKMGLIVSSSYLVVTCFLKWAAYSQFQEALATQNIDYIQMDTRPAALNTILWNANVEVEDAYLLADYSFLDSQPISFESYPKNHQLLGELIHDESVQSMIHNSENWYTITKKEDQLYFNDLRFGLLSTEPQSQDFVFQYLIEVNDSGKVEFTEVKGERNPQKLLSQLWTRLKGN
ncbi:inner membrane protein [Nonlabens dokdonensis]|uniref:Integral membrane protein n=2 Tax=Nonlabens dokdonensis TaxID=328515 RepID=L7W536_NONDD|nr:metal-dependent hydrolase [Nonlabens dokdonensis]AGC75267.1 integral membrane protein [Nonlabens dokdonensis DSW-6]PZX38995.1 inner membrane protein [Nonlabens dokdonensis]